jgi:hypothetical protein
MFTGEMISMLLKFNSKIQFETKDLYDKFRPLSELLVSFEIFNYPCFLHFSHLLEFVDEVKSRDASGCNRISVKETSLRLLDVGHKYWLAWR